MKTAPVLLTESLHPDLEMSRNRYLLLGELKYAALSSLARFTRRRPPPPFYVSWYPASGEIIPHTSMICLVGLVISNSRIKGHGWAQTALAPALMNYLVTGSRVQIPSPGAWSKSSFNLLIQNGRVISDHLAKERVVRTSAPAGIGSFHEVALGVLEGRGGISCFK